MAAADSRASKLAKPAVGTAAALSTSFMKALDPSSSAPSAPGPMTARPCARRVSASPATRGSPHAPPRGGPGAHHVEIGPYLFDRLLVRHGDRRGHAGVARRHDDVRR